LQNKLKEIRQEKKIPGMGVRMHTQKNEITPKTQEITHKVPKEGFCGVWKSEIGDLGYL
jgi:uncharacterized protein YktB (UPF0637 family)